MVLWFPRLRLRWPSEDFGPPRRFRRPALRVSSCEVCGPPSCVGDGSLVLPRSFFFRASDFVIGGGFPAALCLLHGSGGASCSSGRPDPVLLEVPLSVLLFSSTATALCLAVLLWWATSLVVRSGLLCFTSAKGWKLPVIPVVGGDSSSWSDLMSSVALLIWRRRCGSSRLFEFLGGLCFLLLHSWCLG